MAQTFVCEIKLNITNGFGDFVLDKIRSSCIPGLIEKELGNCGKVSSDTHKWDSGILTHDLYLKYEIDIDCYKLIKVKQGRLISKILKYSAFDKSAIKNSLIKSIKKGFMDDLKGKGLVVIFKEIKCTY